MSIYIYMCTSRHMDMYVYASSTDIRTDLHTSWSQKTSLSTGLQRLDGNQHGDPRPARFVTIYFA